MTLVCQVRNIHSRVLDIMFLYCVKETQCKAFEGCMLSSVGVDVHQ